MLNAGSVVRATELLLTNVDSGYCGTYTCMFIDPVENASIFVNVGKYLAIYCYSVSIESDMSVYAKSSVGIVVIIYNYAVPAFEEPLMGQMVFVETPNLKVIFTCTVNGGAGNTVEIEWSGSVVVLLNYTTNEVRDGVFMSNLTLTNVTTLFTGTYFCTAKYKNSLCTKNITSNASLVIVSPPTIKNQTELTLTVDSEVNVSIYFEFSSLPSRTDVQCSGPIGVVNRNDASDSGINLERVDNYSALQIRLRFTIASVNYTHGGIYSCIANNTAGEVEATTLLLVRPVVEPPEVLARNGDMVTLMCLAQSFPEPSYVWERLRDSSDSDTISDVFGYVSGSGENMMATHPFLDFETVRYGDEGVYRCMVNIKGTWKASSDGVLLAGTVSLKLIIEICVYVSVSIYCSVYYVIGSHDLEIVYGAFQLGVFSSNTFVLATCIYCIPWSTTIGVVIHH